MNLKEYYQELEAHDWFYNYSEDQLTWRKGEASYNKLSRVAEIGSPKYRELFTKFKQHKLDPKNNPKPESPQ